MIETRLRVHSACWELLAPADEEAPAALSAAACAVALPQDVPY